MEKELLRVEKLCKNYQVSQGIFRKKSRHIEAVKEISFSIRKGETLGVVGESGCGKSTAAKMIAGLLQPSSGSIYFDGEGVFSPQTKGRRKRGTQLQMVFQNPYASLNPKMTMRHLLEEPLRIRCWPKEKRNQRVKELLDYVGFDESLLGRPPYAFSGGQRQRIAIARALAVNPSFMVLDEPVSALDVSIQAQILNLLLDLQQELALTYLFISHDLGVVQYISDRVCVMYRGSIVESADCRNLYSKPLHPYTKLLIQSIPVPDPKQKQELLTEEPISSNPTDTLSGCQFYDRCPLAKAKCKDQSPQLKEEHTGHSVACHLYGDSEG